MIRKKVRGFDLKAETIRQAVEKAAAAEKSARQAGTIVRPAETANGVLYAKCYSYYRSLKRDPDKLKLLRKHLGGGKGSRWSRHDAVGPEVVLRLLEPPPPGKFLTASRRHRIGLELEFADRCSIHWNLLLAFLYECGGQKRISELVKDPQATNAPWIAHYQRLSKLLREDAKTSGRITDPATSPRKRKKSESADS